MQIASITFDGEKKKPANYIIPATFFTSFAPLIKEVSKVKKEALKVESTPTVKSIEKVVEKVLEVKAEATKPPVLQNIKRRNNSLSLKSVHQKKEDKKTTIEVNYDNHPKDNFTEKDLQKAWNQYQQQLIKKGEKSMASILAADLPTLGEDFKIQFSLPNKLMEDQLKTGKPKLVKFLRETLNNFGLHLEVIVNETIEKKFAYTPQEKFNKLKEKNPFMEKLKDIFELDL
jgi:DNA polymerase-3 subunit gamma/tau